MNAVLAPTDGSTRALHAMPWAAKLAGPGGVVVLLRVVPPQPAYAELVFALSGGDGTIQNIQDAWGEAAKADMDKAAELIAGTGVTVEQVVTEGDPAEKIVAIAAERRVDMIAMASQGHGPLGRVIFGSVADRVARSSFIPVLILRASDEVADRRVAVSRIVVPLDGSEIARRAIPVACTLAQQFEVPVYVVCAVNPTTTFPVAPGVFGAAPVISAEVTDQIWQEAESRAQTTINDAVSQLQANGVDASGAMLSGSPYYAISEVTKPSDLLVLTSHGRGGIRRWLLGSVAEKLIREADAPVLLVPATERNESEHVHG